MRCCCHKGYASGGPDNNFPHVLLAISLLHLSPYRHVSVGSEAGGRLMRARCLAMRCPSLYYINLLLSVMQILRICWLDIPD
ncbi:hypothetical protein CHARACLAT_000110 [Characodon lateralis]|uniref:Uncharacterized protein n=1 Tax=Characodon lateralis TaxID=208331 RepID=A0ABU7DCA3_9TELE|nr:hypothetical protein [Characodon lateralis]